MEKAWDLKYLVTRLKPMGLELGEELAKTVMLEVFDFCEKSAILSENKYDDFAVPVLATVKPFVMKQLEEINKVDNV
mgnify:CR=1 FL=1